MQSSFEGRIAPQIVLVLLVASVLSQAPMNPGMSGHMAPQPAQQVPNVWQMMMYRNLFDMNWMQTLLFSNGLPGLNGGAGSALPWLLFGNM